jgi:ribosome-associated toxin RatA of RatAB toxin-antitoxin module
MFTTLQTLTGGRFGARRLFFVLAVLAAGVLHEVRLTAADEASRPPVVLVSEKHGTYSVSACFRVPQPLRVVRAVLTDYESIPRFMPHVKASVVVERTSGRAVVEQEAVSRFMMFSKRVFLVLEVNEGTHTLAFRDRSGRSFRRYEGAWTLTDAAGDTEVSYRLTAEPSFDVPQMILKHLLGRDSEAMIGGLRAEMAARGITTARK